MYMYFYIYKINFHQSIFLKSKVEKEGKMKKCSVYEYKIIDTVMFFD